ncbi:MAG: tetratricopeptide repeat protein [Pirellulales bacterium]|nr:tetratricopeptide repeat protein [Pirellulales bacterium]
MLVSADGAGQGGVEEAGKALMAGRYEEAAELFAPQAEKNPAAALGLARCQEERGKYDEAVKTLESCEKENGQNALLLAELARLAFERGDYKSAQARVDAALKLDSKQPLARWMQAELHRVHGRLDEAENGCRRLIRYYNDNEIEDPEALRWIGRAAAQFARWNRQSDQFDFLVNELYPDALKLAADFWPAKYETGLLFLEKYNYAAAAEEFRAALNINPHAAEVHAALARAWLAQHDIDKAESEVARALELNPRLLDAWLAKADIAWANLLVPETLQLLEKQALPLNPLNEETLGRIAACYLILDGLPAGNAEKNPGAANAAASRFETLHKKAAAQNPHAGDFYFALAESLAKHNKQPSAEKYYREAVRAMPKLPGPHAQLGLLYMSMGREQEARPLLKEAFDGDPYNVRVHNMLNLLEVLDQMQCKETEHCRLRFEKDDALLGRYAERRLEEIFQELCRKFDYAPPRKTAIDIFNQAKGQSGHAWFSTRVSGLPFIGTVAASTGHLVAMVSPGDAQPGKRFNWVRVLRHEMVHVITLQQTDFNIPHWFTEGLAVWCEGHSRPAQWNKLLLERVPKGKQFNLDDIESGFTRPQSGGDWAMAYCQAELYVDYLLKVGGEASLKKMLDAYARGANTAGALKSAFNTSQPEFEKGYLEFLRDEVRRLKGLPWPEVQDIVALKKVAAENPQDAAALAALANGYIQRGAEREAAELAEKALKLKPEDQLAAYVKARLLVKTEKRESVEEAAALLEKALDLKSPEPNALNLLAGLKLKAKQYDEAARLYALGEKLDPANPQWTRSLTRVYVLSGDKEKLIETLSRLAAADVDDLATRKNLAQLALARKDYETAERAAREGLEIDVRDADLHVALAESCSGRHNRERAIEAWEIAVELEPEKTKPRFDLANAYLEDGQTVKAGEMLKKLLESDPDYPGGEELLKKIDRKEK